nr:FecR domain-containing protein [Pseudoxanthomonas sp. LH2527]
MDGKTSVSEEGRESSRAIEATAAQWVARLDRAPLTPAEDRELQDWLRGDPRSRGAFMRARALWSRPEAILVVADAPAAEPTSSPLHQDAALPRDRRRVRHWLAALAASLLLSVFIFVTIPVPTAYATAKGEMRRIPLTDGSTLTLNTDSRVDLYEDNHRLLVKVRRGEVLVEATGDGGSLRVEVDGRYLDAGAAVFVVRKLPGKPTQVVVQNGEVAVPASGKGRELLAANTRASLIAASMDVQVSSLSADQMQRELAWREGKLAFRGETLAEAAAEFARYNDASIEIADARLAALPITGYFAANNPAGFSRAVAGVFGAKMRQETKNRIVIED